jgi:hypothetical protein
VPVQPTLSNSATKALDVLKGHHPNWFRYEEWRKASELARSTFKDARGVLLKRGFVESHEHRYRYKAGTMSGPAVEQRGPDAGVRPEDTEKGEAA